ncbi:MAG: tetratricopeptide repeat protein, partial [bacterium]|nr:tetratricopeptide repeat protein [bacterium]
MADKRLSILKRANKLFRQGKTEAAVKEYKKILALKSDDLEVRRIVGDLELRQNNNQEAIEQFEWIGDYYLKEGFFAKAIAMYKRISRVDPNYEKALFKLADLYTKQGLVMEAKQIYLDIAEECKRQNNQKKALDMYKKILEFDRGNIKMRTLLADNYLKEGMEENALEEYLIAADILLAKKNFPRVEDFLTKALNKLKHIKLVEKLLYCYTSQNQDEKAIALLNSTGDAVSENINLLKTLGELHLKKNQMDQAEEVFKKIAFINPEETEVIMRLGKVYLQREEYDKTYELFLPIVDKNISMEKFEEAASLLRFVIASNNMYIPALTKLAAIFKLSGKTNNLIALYESLIPVYEKKGMTEQLKQTLEELIQLSDTPFTYEEQLEKINGMVEKEQEEEQEEERESEFVNYNLRVARESMAAGEVDKAIEVLVKAKNVFPGNSMLRLSLFQVYKQGGLE